MELHHGFLTRPLQPPRSSDLPADWVIGAGVPAVRGATAAADDFPLVCVGVAGELPRNKG